MSGCNIHRDDHDFNVQKVCTFPLATGAAAQRHYLEYSGVCGKKVVIFHLYGPQVSLYNLLVK